MRRGRFAVATGVYLRAKAVSRRAWRLVLTGRGGLPRRQMRSRRRFRPARLRRPGGFRRAAEANEPSEEIGAMLKQGQEGF